MIGNTNQPRIWNGVLSPLSEDVRVRMTNPQEDDLVFWKLFNCIGQHELSFMFLRELQLERTSVHQSTARYKPAPTTS